MDMVNDGKDTRLDTPQAVKERPNRAASTGQSSVTSYTTRGMPVTTLSPSREKPQP